MPLIYLARVTDESQENKSYTGYVGPDDLTGQNRRLVCLGTDYAELDVAYFVLYDIPRDEIDYILSTFQAIANEDADNAGLGTTHKLILAAYESIRP